MQLQAVLCHSYTYYTIFMTILKQTKITYSLRGAPPQRKILDAYLTATNEYGAIAEW